jgi:hypothetical protein
MHYQYYRSVVASDVVLPLPVCAAHPDAYTFEVIIESVSGSRWMPDNESRHEFVSPNGSLHLSVARHGSTILLQFPQQADFLIDSAARRITGFPALGLDSNTLTHLLIDQVLPRLMSSQGQHVQHAGAVLVDGGAVLFTGQSGYGKSTLASGFHFNGYPVISDDALFIERADGAFHAASGYSGFRLWPDSAHYHRDHLIAPGEIDAAAAKQRFVIADTAPLRSGAPIRCIFVLSPPDAASEDVRIVSLPAVQACWILLRQAFRLLEPNRDELAAELSFYADLGNQVPIFSLSYPRTFVRLADVREKILEHVHALTTRTG